jgi:hypothetical protein
MPLTKAQCSLVEKARVLGAGGAGIRLDDAACLFLIAVVADDLGLADKFKQFRRPLPQFFQSGDLDRLRLPGVEFEPLLDELFQLDADADTYFACLAELHKRRLKYQHILRSQPLPTMDQVGPRGLLQFGSVSPRALAAILFWRKWLFDLDNRAAQETGYVFEPIIASALGGTSVSAKESPIRSHRNKKQSRQVDCIVGKRAYEFKIRVTVAASGQGRWEKELDYAIDCRKSGFTPVLVVLDPTPNPKLDELSNVFVSQKGEVYAGDAAWQHLEDIAGRTMGIFLEKYVRQPMRALLEASPSPLPPLKITMDSGGITISVGDESLFIH